MKSRDRSAHALADRPLDEADGSPRLVAQATKVVVATNSTRSVLPWLHSFARHNAFGKRFIISTTASETARFSRC